MKKALALLVAIVVAILFARLFPVADWVVAVTRSLRDLGPAGGVAYVFVYAMLASAFVPGSVLTMVAGATWGLFWGTLIIVPGTALATVASAWLGRTMLRDAAEPLLARYPLLVALDRAFAGRAFRFVVLLRLSPVFPFAPGNYALGATSAPLWALGAGTLVGLVPVTMVWVYFGTIAGEAITAGGLPESPWRTVLLAVGLPITVFIMVWLGRLAKAELDRAAA